MIHYYIVYNQNRQNQIISIYSEKDPCPERDEHAIKSKTSFHNIAYIRHLKSEKSPVAKAAVYNSITGQQRP